MAQETVTEQARSLETQHLQVPIMPTGSGPAAEGGRAPGGAREAESARQPGGGRTVEGGRAAESVLVHERSRPSEGLRGFEPEIQEHPRGNCCCDSPPELDPLYSQLDQYIDRLAGEEGIMIRVLHFAQNLFGYLPREVQIHIAKRLGKSLAEVYGVVSFYHYFSTEPKAQYTVEVCMGTACYVKGAASIIAALEKELGIKVGQTTQDQKFGLRVSRCIGACGLAPVMVVGDDIHGRLRPDMIPGILKQYREKEKQDGHDQRTASDPQPSSSVQGSIWGGPHHDQHGHLRSGGRSAADPVSQH